MIVKTTWTPVRSIFASLTLRCKRPINPAYPKQLKILGDHLRTVRLDRGLSQPEAAKLLKVTPDTVTGWELNKHEPPARLAKRIIHFLRYVPEVGGQKSLGKRLRQARQILGHTQEQASKKMSCDESNMRYIELEKRKPQKNTSQRIERNIWSAEQKKKV